MPTHTVVSTVEAITRTLTTKHEINMQTRQHSLSLCVCSGAVNNKLHISTAMQLPIVCPTHFTDTTSLFATYPPPPKPSEHTPSGRDPPLLAPRPYLSLVESISRVGVVQERSLRRLAALRMVGRVLGEGCVWLGLELIICE